MKYSINFINGEKVYTSARTGKKLTGAAKRAAQEAEEQRAINEAVENALILDWYEENAIEIDAEQERVIAQCRNVHGETFILTKSATVTVWPSAFGQGFTRKQAHKWLAEIRAKRHAERNANVKRNHHTAHKVNTIMTTAITRARKSILGAKAIREGRKIRFTFRHIVTLRNIAWQNLPPRVCGKIGVAKTDNGFYAWAFAGIVNDMPIWIITKVYAGLNFPVVLDLTKKGGDDNPPRGSQPRNDSNEEAEYNAFCDALDAIIHDKKEETPKQIAISGWALTETMIRTIETAYENDDVKDYLTRAFRKWTAEFARYALDCLGWKYNAERGTTQNAVIEFLKKRDDEKFPIFTTTRYDGISTFTALQAVTRCLKHARKNSEQAVVIEKEIRAPLARLCRKLIQGIAEAQREDAIE